MIEEAEKAGLSVMHIRKVPVDSDILGREARQAEPDIKQIFITGTEDQNELELKLYILAQAGRVEGFGITAGNKTRLLYLFAVHQTDNLQRHARNDAAEALLPRPVG